MNQRVIEDFVTFEPLRQHALVVDAGGRTWIVRPDLVHALPALEPHPELPTIDW